MQEGGGLDDLDGVEVFEVQEMGITGDDVVGLAFKGCGEEHIVGWVGFHFRGEKGSGLYLSN